MTTAQDNAQTVGEALAALKATSGLSLNRLSNRLYAMLGEYAPSVETIRRLHTGDPRTADPEKLDTVILAALADIYGVKVAAISERAAQRSKEAGDLLVRQSHCSSRRTTQVKATAVLV